MIMINGLRCGHCVEKLLQYNASLPFVAMKGLLILFIAILRIRFFHTVTTIVIFGKFSSLGNCLKISKTAPMIFGKLSQHMLDNSKILLLKFS